ncbi:MAG TPA: MCP four helix bundle domain-containing protein, partial [Bryobacteraceae bacterium]|nr:MCP four helix bundle domain-containing protein [Bryobacteraceae bacterium]
MTSRMKLSTKLIGGVGTVGALAVLLGAASILAITSINKSMQYAVNIAGKRRTIVDDLYSMTLRAQSLDRALMLRSIMQQASGAAETQREYRDVMTSVRNSLGEYQKLVEDDAGRRGYETLRGGVDQLFAAHDELVQFMDKQQFDQVQKTADERVMPRADAIIAASGNLVKEEAARMTAASASAESKASLATWLSIIFTLICLTVGGAVTVVVRQISRTLLRLASEMSGGAEQVASAATQVAAVSQSLAQASS